MLLEEARRIVHDSERALVLARSASRRISIGLLAWLTGYLFYRIGPILLKQHGDVQIDVRTLSSPNQIVALQKRKVNLGFLHGPITLTLNQVDMRPSGIRPHLLRSMLLSYIAQFLVSRYPSGLEGAMEPPTANGFEF